MPSRRRRFSLLLLLVLALPAVAWLPLACDLDNDEEEPTPPDVRLVGTWRDTTDASFTDEWTLQAGVDGTAGRSRIDRNVTLTTGTPDTIDLRGQTYSRDTGTPGAFQGDFSRLDGTRASLLQFTGSNFELDINDNNASHRTEEHGTIASAGTTATLTTQDSGTVWTDADADTLELMTAGARRWYYSVIGGGSQLQILHSSSWTRVAGASLGNSAWTRFGVVGEPEKIGLQFFSGGGSGGTVTLTELFEDAGPDVTWRQRRSYRWVDNLTYLAVNERIYGDYELQNSDAELVVYAQRPLVERRIIMIQAGPPTAIITIGLPDGTEPNFTNTAGSAILDGTFVNGPDEFEFNDTAKTYVIRRNSVVTETGRYTVDTGTNLVSFFREYRWFRQ